MDFISGFICGIAIVIFIVIGAIIKAEKKDKLWEK